MKSAKFVSYAKIATFIGITYNEVQHICRQALKFQLPSKPQQLIRKLGEEHINFLRNERTLELWAGKTMHERVVLFHR